MKTPNILVSKMGRLSLYAQKYAPQLLIGFGTVTFIETVVTACVATTRANEILDRHAEGIQNAEAAQKVIDDPEIPNDPMDEMYDIRKEKAIIYAHTVADFSKLYAPSIALGGLTLTCFFKAYGIMNTRYIGVVAAYNAVSTAFNNYRARVNEEMGANADRHFLYGTEYDTIQTTVDNGDSKKSKTTTETVENVDRKNISGYAKVFDRKCPEWDSNYIYNLKWLRANETAANDILNTRGHIFLNEVYDMIGFEHTPEGAVAGWIKGQGDGYVSFGLDDPNNESARKFINGEDNVVLLDFNVDGIIFDKI